MKGPLFKWFGSKWLAAKHYPPPLYSRIVEPYAGSAGYSLRHVEQQVVIWDNDPNLQVLWPWLISEATEAAIREIPTDLPEGVDIRTLGLSSGQAMLLKHWQRTNNVGDCWTTSPWGNKPGQWTENTRARVGEEIEQIHHWEFRPPDFSEVATYFFDPPYLFNYRYRNGHDFDHKELSRAARFIRGQVIVCEAACPKTGAVPEYLPFEFFGRRITSRRKATQSHHSHELMFCRVSEEEMEKSAAIFTQDDLNAAGKTLVETEHALKTTKSDFDAAVEPFKAEITKVKAEYDPVLLGFSEQSQNLRSAVLAYLDAMRTLRDECIAAGQTPPHTPELPLGLSLRKVTGHEILDPTRIPLNYWCIDERAIKKALENDAELEIPGVERTERDTLVVRVK